jgi:EAL and modified HD-GYP domain-containing signal transduction protein
MDKVGAVAGKTEKKSQAPQPCRFLARQPILNVRNQVVAYELLFRTGWENWFAGEREEATRKALDHCLYVGIESITDNHPAFVKCTGKSVLSGLVKLLPPKLTVIELLETAEPNADLVKACVDLRKLGYRLALDDFVPTAECQPLVEIADYVKVDFRLSDAYTRRQTQRMMRYSNAALVAEKLEDQQAFQAAHAEGYLYFQGYFFCRPQIIANREIPAGRLNYLRLLAELTREPLDLNEIIRTVEVEASLCYRLLRLANSALWGIRNDITSVRSALMVVGEERFRLLVSVAAACALVQNQGPTLIGLSLERARFCELLAERIGERSTEQFMLGMLSLLDAMLETPMESIVRSLPLRPEAKAALIGAENPTAVPLCLIRSFEAGAWGRCAAAVETLGVSEETLTRLYLESLEWARESLATS